MPNDGYGKKRIQRPLPLSFDRVNEGRLPQSNSLLFQLPFEILGQILQHVDPASLPSLALVNRDCRQLARSRQFASIQLDCGESSLDLIELLRAEDGERDANGLTLSPSLGVCIRRIKVTEGSTWLGRYQINFGDASFMMLDREERYRRRLKAREFYHEEFLPTVQSILWSRRMLPHLEELGLQCLNGFPQSFLNSLTQSSIKHLKLSGVYVEENLTIEIPDSLVQSWPLRTLHLEFLVDVSHHEVTTDPLCASIVRFCAPTLESLTWTERCRKVGHSFATAGLNSAPCFTRLRKLVLRYIHFLDSSMLDALIHDNLRTLGVRKGIDSVYASFFQNRGFVPSLRTFHLQTLTKPSTKYTGPILCFLMANSHLSMLSLEWPLSAIFLETQLLPFLSSSFSKLTSLSLFWKPTSISESALEMISSLKTLQQIHLSAGYSGFRRTFQIDHKAMQKHLQKLHCLKKIAFSRDTYGNGSERASLGFYYEDKFLAEPDPQGLKERESVWEQMHRKHMLTEANEYVYAMPQLEWLYFGQIPMGFEELQGTQVKTAVALTAERDTCWALLKDMFGVYEESSIVE